jgi:3-oxoacyl-[acyl-carrier protein] reductase
MFIVTGASGGLGSAICERLISKYDVLGIVNKSNNKFSFNTFRCDVTDIKKIDNLVTELRSKNVRIDGLINAAGVASMNLALMTPDIIVKRIFEVNVFGTMNMCQKILPLMISNKKGKVINFSTIATKLNIEGEAIYASSKAAVEKYSQILAKEISGFNITVNTISPGPIKTNLIKGVSENKIMEIVKKQNIKFLYSSDDICDFVELLIDDKSNKLTGQNLGVV